MDRCCGLDVHKDSVFACILDEQGEKNLEGRYGTLTPELENAGRIWLRSGSDGKYKYLFKSNPLAELIIKKIMI
jgi:hypothetical protein